MKLNIYNQSGEKTGDIELSSKVFDVETNEALVHQAMVAQMANQRQVLAHTKDRSEVRGGGRKPWRQKGTGRARAGSTRSPIWIGGGVTFGPTKERNFKKKINQKMKQKAVSIVLSDKVRNNNITIIDTLKIDEFKTKLFNEFVNNIEKKVLILEDKNLSESKTNKETKKKKALKPKRSILIVVDNKDEKIKYSGRNLANVELININNINILDLLKNKNLVITQKAVEMLNDKYKK